jgi:hypothetical protein
VEGSTFDVTWGQVAGGGNAVPGMNGARALVRLRRLAGGAA